MGQNLIFPRFGYPATGRPKRVVVARKPIHKGGKGFAPTQTRGSKHKFSFHNEKI